MGEVVLVHSSEPAEVLARLRELDRGERNEVFSAVNSGRAVRDPQLAPLATAYARLYSETGGVFLLRQWWVLALLGVSFMGMMLNESWIAFGVMTVAFTAGLIFSQSRLPAVRRAETLNSSAGAGEVEDGALD